MPLPTVSAAICVPAAAPLLGAGTDAVLSELSLGDDEIAELHRVAVV